ncbi:MAG: ABC transporter ATP-binding protein [Planctomycetales bacterium]|nr:ABC transporter ATP-binding protein [Planctomycetales bacterium]
MIRVENVHKAYGRKIAVADLSLEVRPGEVFALLGANGAGKTTTIKMLVGLLMPDAGQLSIGGFDVVRQTREASHLVGYVPDQPYLYDKLTGREFLAFIADMYGMPADAAQQALDEQIARFELHEFADRLTETYSHGMKQRVVFAAAFVHRPQVVILDEPMVGLDPHSMRVVKDLLRQQAQLGTTIFMSTHILSLAEEIADRIGVFHDGRLQFVGTVDELRRTRQRDGASLEKLFLELTSPASSPRE